MFAYPPIADMTRELTSAAMCQEPRHTQRPACGVSLTSVPPWPSATSTKFAAMSLPRRARLSR